MARNCEAIGSDLAPFARLPEEPNGVRTALIPLRDHYHPLPKLFCQQR